MIIPVVDIKNNECVSGKSGNRNSYSKLDSIYGNSPLEIAKNLKKSGFEYLYVADLDKIESVSDNDDLISEINEIIPVILDNGISDIKDIQNNERIATSSIIATETIDSLDNFIQILDYTGNENAIVSLDIKDNQLLIKNNDIELDDILSVIKDKKIRHVIILNISNVGTKNSKNSSIEKYIINQIPYSTCIIGGGITNSSILLYEKEGIENFLIGTILHQGILEK